MRFLHVACGTSTTSTIEAAGIPGARSIWADPLYEGPVPDVGDDELIKVRSAYLSDGQEVDRVNDLRLWRKAIADDSYDELVLWYEHDLFDQLNLLQLLTWMRPHVAAPKRATLICVGAFPGHPDFKGLGELSPHELASLFDTRAAITAAQYDLAERAWSAFRAPTPEPLERVRRGDTHALPFLAAALERFLQEFPWTGDGLSRTERRLLHLAERGPIALRTAFPRMHDDERLYYVTDLSLMGLADELSRTSPPLVAFDRAADGASRWQLNGTVALTDAGRDVLTGRRDRVGVGIDRWLGGVHLRNGSAMWRWNEERGEIGRA
ncbi:MAG TPA: hypothetical protein VIW45_06940 [Vicinamibacterales bacterium]|jgi:hypothetical protein